MELRFLSCLGLHFMAPCVLFVRCVIIDNTFSNILKFFLWKQDHLEDICFLFLQVLIRMNFNDTFTISVDGFCDPIASFALMRGHSS